MTGDSCQKTRDVQKNNKSKTMRSNGTQHKPKQSKTKYHFSPVTAMKQMLRSISMLLSTSNLNGHVTYDVVHGI